MLLIVKSPVLPTAAPAAISINPSAPIAIAASPAPSLVARIRPIPVAPDIIADGNGAPVVPDNTTELLASILSGPKLSIKLFPLRSKLPLSNGVLSWLSDSSLVLFKFSKFASASTCVNALPLPALVTIVAIDLSCKLCGGNFTPLHYYARLIVKLPELIWKVSPVSIVFEVVTAPQKRTLPAVAASKTAT